MQDLEVYRKFVTLANGKEVLIRLDRSGIIKFFQRVPGKISPKSIYLYEV
jgi:hypothetical protein